MTTAGVTTEVTVIGGITMSVVGLGAEVGARVGLSTRGEDRWVVGKLEPSTALIGALWSLLY